MNFAFKKIPSMCLICPSPFQPSVAETINLDFIRFVKESRKTARSKSHKINHPQLIQLVMLGAARGGAGARAGGGSGHQPISPLLRDQF